MHFLVLQVPFPRGLYYGVGHGMREMFLQTGGQPQHLIGAVAAEGDHLGYLGRGIGQGAGFVKHNGVGAGHDFQILSSLDGYMGSASLAHGRQHGQRHG